MSGPQFLADRRKTISTCRELADVIDNINSDSRIAEISGTSASIFGTISMIAIKAVLAATPLAGVAVVIGIAGCITALGANIGGYVHINSKYEQALAAVKADRTRTEQFLTENRFRIAEYLNIATSTVTSIGVMATILEYVLRTGDAALDGAAAATMSAKLAKMSKVAGRIGTGISYILLPLDIFTLVGTSKDIYNGKKHGAAVKLRLIANELETILSKLEIMVSDWERKQ